ncbi:hypothetical protein [Streptomyces sp. S.PNR 29]|uniref:hypothetical protein n=1 Tax=Streptomyces sp. S.PNR 29 TaxID=2973805 RepID=UPI0025B2135D|nr:hypothetical protein [Streptomyces sp. S.PNR 29]MDN0197370.1 hypothetical protein [Streptomyces sp. S.PNR 29]
MATERTVALIVLRLAAAGTAVAMGAIHLHLWYDGYRYLDTIGPLFLLNAIGAGLLAMSLLITPTRLLSVLATLGTLFTAGTLVALIVSLTSGLFGFQETLDANLVEPTLAVEAAGCVLLVALALLSRHGGARAGRAPGTGPRTARRSDDGGRL